MNPVPHLPTSLSPVGQWSDTLRILVEVVVRAPVGMALIWDEDRTLIYNDACRHAGARCLG